MNGFDILELNNNLSKALENVGINIDKRIFNVNTKNAAIQYFGKDFLLKRYFRIEAGEKIAIHEKFLLPEELQDKGISKIVLKEFYKQYKNCGIDKILLRANDKVGGWAWARYGFCIDKNEIENFLIQIPEKQRIKMKDIVNNFYKDKKNKNKQFPMNLLTLSEFKNCFANTNWYGELNFNNLQQIKTFENYLNQ